jgi:hypothetical protein
MNQISRWWAGVAVAVSMCIASSGNAAPLYSQNFDADDSANWTINNNGNGTNAANVYFDYSTIGIPSAPNSLGGTTRGLKLAANLATAPTSGNIPGISASPTGQSFTGDYTLRFDMWSNYIGPLGVGATGSTMLGYAGIMSSGTTANFPGLADGLWFGATGDGQSASDYRVYSPERMTSYDIFPASGNPLDAKVVYAAGSRNQTAALYTGLFPAGATAPGSQSLQPTQTGSTPAGAFGFRWHDVVIEKTGGIVTWTVNGTLLTTVDTSLFTVPTGGSNILFGYADTNLTTNSNAQLLELLQFTVIDNVRVLVPEPSAFVMAALTAFGWMASRNRR